MKSSFTIAAIAGLCAVVVSATATQAQFYGSLSAGPAFVGDTNFRDPSTVDLLLNNGTGWSISGAIGYRYSPMFRTELNLGYLDGNGKGTLQQNIITIAACGITPSQPCLDAAVQSDIKAKTAMAMGYVDIPTNTAITPYIGAGVGLTRQNLNVTGTARNGAGTASPFTVLDDSDTEIAMRGAVGIALDFGGVTGDVGYTYSRTGRPSLAGTGSLVAFNVNSRLNVHAVNATVRFPF